MHTPTQAPSPLIGRDRELAILRAQLDAAITGHGGLVLIGGEAGIGKTALAEAVCADASQQGALVLVGHCYDLSETPPYGPWTEARSQFPPSSGSPPGSIPLLPNALRTAARSSQEFFAEVRAFFTDAAMRQPLLLLLDDMQWADPASLDLLRFLARSLATLPLLLVVNYRPDNLDDHHPLAQLIPLLVREARAERIDLGPLSAMALQTLVHRRYFLGTADEARLVAHLIQRTAGNALFATEMLRALEEHGAVTTDGDALGNLDEVAVPPLLRRIIVGRVTRLGAKAESLLGVAAVIGQQVPLDIWARVSDTDDTTAEAVAEQGLGARLLVETREGVAFAHALIREALYEAMPVMRRRRLHRTVAETLAESADPAPDVVAYHLRAAGDARVTRWLIEAGWRAYRAFAYATARAHFAEALPVVTGRERARVLLALASLDRFQNWGILYAEEAVATAHAAGDEILTAIARFRLGITLAHHARSGEARLAMEAAERTLEGVPDAALPNFYGIHGLALQATSRRNFRAVVIANSGRWREALALLGGTPETMIELLPSLEPHGVLAVWYTSALLGRPDVVRRATAVSHAHFAAAEDAVGRLAVQMVEGYTLLPYMFDDREARQRYEQELAEITRQVERSVGAVPPHLNGRPFLIVTGQWAEARSLWAQRRTPTVSTDLAWDLPPMGEIARAQGEQAEAWALVHEQLPDGPRTEPGTTHFTAVDLFDLAAHLALDDGEHVQGRQWLEAHDRWLEWAGPEVRWGRANGQLVWAEYHRARGEPDLALQYAEQALAEASTPRQPLALLAARRLLGVLATEAGQFEAADGHLQASLALTDACADPYEHALTLLALAERHAATGDGAAAQRMLTEVRSVCTPLGARQALDRAERLAARLPPTGGAPAAAPTNLSPRETEVLRLIAAGHPNPAIAATLSLSVRTIERHVENLYRKLDVHGRAEAIAYAFRHDLA
jgi:DNA-binding CsgD family transcriptional regulator